MPTLRDVVASARLVTRTGTERSFWGESWASHTTLLTELVGVLRASRPTHIVDVDAGWRPDRDFSLAIGRWGWLHVRTLVEEHEHGTCLFRMRARLRPSFVGTLQGVTLAVLMAGGMSASFFIYDLSVTVLVAAVAIAVIGAVEQRHQARNRLDGRIVIVLPDRRQDLAASGDHVFLEAGRFTDGRSGEESRLGPGVASRREAWRRGFTILALP